MKQSQLNARKPRSTPSHVADSGRIVLGAGVRLPALRPSTSNPGKAPRGSDLRPAAEHKNA